MRLLKLTRVLTSALLISISCSFSPQLFAEAVEQTVRLSVTTPSDGSQCKVQAVFKGDHDNCDNDKAKGRADCTKDTGCVCSRQDKHVSWKMEGDQPFNIVFDQGSANPFVSKGQSECNLKSNKKGQLRCRVKGKDVPKGEYKYSVQVLSCTPARSAIKIY
jgi:hypothetical protein